MKNSNKNFSIVAIGASAGGLDSLMELLAIDLGTSAAIVIVQHLSLGADQSFAEVLGCSIKRTVIVVNDKLPIEPGKLYLAPAGYHTLVNFDLTFALDAGERVNHSKPSIDVFFESVAEVFGAAAIGIILSGANQDGAQGLKTIVDHGGRAFAQDPASSTVATMPSIAANTCNLDSESIAPPKQIGAVLARLLQPQPASLTGSDCEVHQ